MCSFVDFLDVGQFFEIRSCLICVARVLALRLREHFMLNIPKTSINLFYVNAIFCYSVCLMVLNIFLLSSYCCAFVTLNISPFSMLIYK